MEFLSPVLSSLAMLGSAPAPSLLIYLGRSFLFEPRKARVLLMAYAFALKHWAFFFGLPADTAIAVAGVMTLDLSSFTYSLVERPLTVALKWFAILETHTYGRTIIS
jgi:hypothetical protein